MWVLDHKESWALKNRRFWTVVLKTLESPLDCKEIKPVNPKGNQSWIFVGRTDAEGETPILWPPDVKNWLIGKDPGAGKDWRQEEKGTREDEMVRWHHRLDGLSLSKLWELVMDRVAWRAAVHGVTKSWTRLSDWTELNTLSKGQNWAQSKDVLAFGFMLWGQQVLWDTPTAGRGRDQHGTCLWSQRAAHCATHHLAPWCFV